MNKAIARAIAILHRAEKAKPKTAQKNVLTAIDILHKALLKSIGDGGDDKNP